MRHREFQVVRFSGGPWAGRHRIKCPLPEALMVPIVVGRPRTWGRDRTELAGVARYELASRRFRRHYVIVKEILKGQD